MSYQERSMGRVRVVEMETPASRYYRVTGSGLARGDELLSPAASDRRPKLGDEGEAFYVTTPRRGWVCVKLDAESQQTAEDKADSEIAATIQDHLDGEVTGS